MSEKTFYDLRVYKKYMSPVVDQGQCNICWAIVITQCVQDILGDPKVNLSFTTFSREILNGKSCLYTPIFEYVLPYILDHGIYCAKTMKRYYPSAYAKISGASGIRNELLKGRSVIAILNAYDGKYSLYNYQKDEIYGYPWWINGEVSQDVDKWHTVCIIGWGQKDNVPFWICRNSWGVTFGNEGYFNMLSDHNCCLIENFIYTFKEILDE